MYKDLLPLGSVVRLKGGNKRIMICGRVQTRADSDKIYDYSACYYPEGIIDPDQMFFFNRDGIEQIYFKGYQDAEELYYHAQVLDLLGELEVKDGKIVPKNQE